MITITLSDRSQRHFDQPVSVEQVAESISPSLARSALAAEIDDTLSDLSTLIHSDAVLKIITDKDAKALEVVRHSTAHLLAYAVKDLFPSAQVTIGPVIENGFYYDFAYEKPFNPEDLIKIEERMHEIARLQEKVTHRVVSREEAITYFKSRGENYKAEIIGDIPTSESIKLYSHGSFTDLCRGPHVPHTGKLKVFKLLKVAGAYWRGDAKREQLQRIYGTAWLRREDQENYLKQIEEAERRDHRKLGKLLDLFHWQEEAPGMVFWHPKGWALWQQVEQYMRRQFQRHGYQEIRTPMVMDQSLWERSGHWDNYREHMFGTESEKRTYAIKPMNCPGHVQVYNHSLHSYRDLPLRLAEFGSCHRNEPSGALHGLMRVRGFVQDDAHIFCTENQVVAETIAFNEMTMRVYQDFGFHDLNVKLALRPDQRAGNDETWDRAELGLREALQQCHSNWEELPGEGAFYGPKIEYHIKDALGRSWQCGTLQLDLVLPERLGAEYVDSDNTRQRPIMLHRAILGSLERFIGILIEHHAGILPPWLAPIQVAIINVAEDQKEYCHDLEMTFSQQNLRVTSDLRNEKIGYKIRDHIIQKIPYLLIIGNKEKESKTISLRPRGSEKTINMTIESFLNKINNEMDVNRIS